MRVGLQAVSKARSLQLFEINLLQALIGFRSGAREISVFFGCDTISLCDR